MRFAVLAAAIVGEVLLLAPSIAHASKAIGLQPSSKWYGIDGNWSSFNFYLGNPGQQVSLTVNTALSEIWVIEKGGCPESSLCTTARGGVFDPSTSASWSPLGAWQLGLKDDALGGNGDYGMETVLFSDTASRSTTSVDNAVVAAINVTDYYEGFLGVGVTQGKFGEQVVNPYISQLAESYGTIPSHSYGYTAGASYVGAGMPASLTLGGYDSLRFAPHDVSFHLNSHSVIPQVLLRGVTASVQSLDQAPTKWNSTSRTLLSYNASNMALIDTTTPWLWLPGDMCDTFAAALNLVWSDKYGVYLFNDSSEYLKLQGSPMSFTFSLSSFDNTDNFGQPLNVNGVVNITISAPAFAQLLRYPFKNQFNYGDPAIPYFPLKRSDSGKIIIGRAFFQEAYMIMSYDKQSFSIHQARFPNDPYSNRTLVDIARPPNSAYPASTSNSSAGPSTGAIVGAAIGACLAITATTLFVWCCCCRRRKRAKTHKTAADTEDGIKDDLSIVQQEEPSSPVRRILTLIRSRRRPRTKRAVTRAHEVSGDNAQPVEVGADAHHEVYELPAPLEPAELDSNDPMSTDEITDLGTEGTEGLSAYEIARRKMERQLQGPVPTYTPPIHNEEKTEQDISPVAHYRPVEDSSPVSSPTYGNNSNSIPSLPSPMTPHPPDWPRRFDLPSPMTVAPPFPSPQFSTHNSDPDSNSYSPVSPQSPHRTYEPSSMSRSNSSQNSPISPGGSLVPPSPSYQRTPIDPSRIICLGPLPENVQLPNHPSPTRIVGSSGRSLEPSKSPVSPVHPHSTESSGRKRKSTETLGSNFTVDEETRIQDGLTRRDSHQEPAEGPGPRSPRSHERIDRSHEIVHVPQPAEKRYSWEDDR